MVGRAAGTVAVLRTLSLSALARRAGRLVPRRLVVGVLTLALGTAMLAGIMVGALLSALL
jgi:hypothetical protein